MADKALKNPYNPEMLKSVPVKSSKSVITPTASGWAGEDKKEEGRKGGNRKSKP